MEGLYYPVTELIGRETELAEVANLVRTHRLVTLVGEGGIGKTRLGTEIARRLLPEFADGARVVEFGPLSDPELVPIAVAMSLGIKFAGGAISAQRVANAFGGKQQLLVLDNCEHVIGAAANMACVLLHTNPDLRVLATSREPLRTEGEHVYRVPPLAVPTEGTDDTNELLGHGAVQLFLTLVKAADPHFSPNERSAAAATTICRRLDGIPLAIELAAARGATLGIEDLASRLDDRFHLLKGGHRTAPLRQRTLRATFDWSYGLLPEPERMVLHRLAIFAGGFTLQAAGSVAVSAEITPSDVIDCVAGLVTKSLVTPGVGDASGQYRLLETTRAYALEKLAGSGEFDWVAQRHAEYYRELFEQADAQWERRLTAEWVTNYHRHMDNVRAALNWAFSPNGHASIGATLTVVSVPLWMRLSLLDECRRTVERALSNIGLEARRDPRCEMKLYSALGHSLFYTRGPGQATGAACANALAIAESLDDTDYQLEALYGLWVCSSFSGQFEAARALSERFCKLTEKASQADSLIGHRLIGASLHYLGNQTEARRHIECVLGGYIAPDHWSYAIRFQIDQRIGAGSTLARILWLQGFPDQAMSAAKGAIEDARASGHILSLCNALVFAACPVSLFVSDLAAAAGFIATLLDHSAKHGLALWQACGHCFEGVLLTKRGDAVRGLQVLRDALDELRETEFVLYYTTFLGALAEALARAGDATQGLAVIDEALTRSGDSKELWCFSELLRIKGELLVLASAPNAAAAAEDHFRQALDWTCQQGVLSLELRSATSLARLWQQQGRGTEAYELLTPAYDRFSEGFETADLRAAKALIDEVRVLLDLSTAPSVQEIAGRAVIAPPHPRTNLPEPISEPIGRATELSEVPDLIRRHRLVTLIGEGGIG